MHRTSTRLVVAFVAVLALAGCDDSDPVVEGDPTGPGVETTTAPEATGTGTGTGTADATLATASSSFGTILVDGDGLTLYVFDNDSGGESSCYDACADTWPPVTGTATAGDGVDASLIGTTERTDGTTQVTYNGRPLYLYAADNVAGDVNGQGVGEVWWVVGPDGEAITASNALPEDETYG
jgi:predicted lipoprotein with Yx(FWY)xxD motif